MHKESKGREDLLLSIIIPVYNVESYLQECIDSVLMNYTNTNIEVILINDGSTDNSQKICIDYLKRDRRVKLINQENKGLSEARNNGIRHASGKYILFLDSDDYIEKGAINRIVNDIAVADKDLYLGRSFRIYEETKQLFQTNYDNIINTNPQEAFLKLLSIRDFSFAAWLVIIRRDYLLKNNLYFMKGILHEDELWVPSVFIKANTLGFLNYGFYCYRQNREGSIITSKNIKREFDKLIILDELAKMFGINPNGDKIIIQRRCAITLGIIIQLAFYQEHKAYQTLLKEVQARLKILNYGKYRFVYYFSKLIGIKKLSKLLCKKN